MNLMERERIINTFISNDVKFHQALGGDGITYFLISKADALMAVYAANESRALDIKNLNGIKINNDIEKVDADGINLGSNIILYGKSLPDGRWITRYKNAPITRVWPSRNYGGNYKDMVFSGPPALVASEQLFIPSLRPGVFDKDIDVVYTWVDSSDPRWILKKRIFTGNEKGDSADNSLRYLSRDELRFSIRSVVKNAPWVRRIYVVTDEQKPSWLKESDKLKIVDHREIFPDPSVLPVFNSHAIESCLHRIPELSESFLYFNDDVFLGKPVTPEHFFDRTGHSRVYSSNASFIDGESPEESRVPTDFAGYNMQGIFARDFGVIPTRKMMHTPFALKRSILEEICERYSEEISVTRSARTRSLEDLALPSMFYHYYSWVTGRAVLRTPGETQYIYLDAGKADSSAKLSKLVSNPPHFFCINATYFEDIPLVVQNQRINKALRSIFPNACRHEK
jgi:hypothetical protein